MIITGYDQELIAWTEQKLGLPNLAPATAIGVSRKDRLAAVVVYNNYREIDIQMTIASVSPMWASKENLRVLFHYPFVQLSVKRVSALTEVTNQRARAFLCRLGFKQEGYHPEMFISGDAVSYGMVRKDCRWLAEETSARGQKFSNTTSSIQPAADCAGARSGKYFHSSLAGRSQ